MARASLISDIAAEEKRITETEESTVFSPEYKQQTLQALTAHIAQMKQEVIRIDQVLDQSRSQG